MDNGSTRLLPSLLGYGAVLFLYPLLIRPALYYALRHRRAERLYRQATVSVSLTSVALLWLMTSRTRFRTSFYSYASIQEIGSDMLSETAYLNLRSPRHESCHLAFEPGSEVVPLALTRKTVSKTALTGREETELTITKRGGAREVSVKNPPAFSEKLFRLKKSIPNEEALGFQGGLSLFGGKVSGTVTDRYPYVVGGTFLLFYGGVIALEHMGANETVGVSERTVYSIPINDKQTVTTFSTGVYDGGKTETEHPRAMERAGSLSFYLSETAGNYTPDARVAAFSVEENARKTVETRGLRHFGMNLLTTVLTVETREGSLISHSALICSPEVLSDNYVASTNSFYRGDPVVLSYKLGKNFRIGELLLEVPDAMFENNDQGVGAAEFRDVISFYNYRTGNFDDTASGKTHFAAKELAPYFALDHTLTVRYAEEKNENSKRLDTVLPWLMAIGENT